jgi:hypothetical protein
LLAEGLRAGRVVRVGVTGSSMLPVLWPGDALLVDPVSSPAVNQGQIVVFLREGRLFAHRLVGRSAADGEVRLITRGDARDQCDPPLQPSEVLGCVRAVFRNGREVAASLQRVSLPVRLVSHAMRRSNIFRRVAMKLHSLRSWIRRGNPCPV